MGSNSSFCAKQLASAGPSRGCWIQRVRYFTPPEKLAMPQSIRLIARFVGSFAESVDGRCTFEEIKYVCFIPPSHGQRELSMMTKARFDPTDPLNEHGIGWRPFTLDLRHTPLLLWPFVLFV